MKYKFLSQVQGFLRAILGWCFVAGTMVCTANGAVPIEKITPGTQVWSQATPGAKPELRPVMETYTNEVPQIHHISYRWIPDRRSRAAPLQATTATISASAEHPFWEIGSQAFLSAEDLEPGHKLRLKDGGIGIVTERRMQARPGGAQFTTYNFAVADHHTYFAGDGGVWVHNLCKKALDRYASKHKALMDEALESGASPAAALDDAFDGLIKKGGADELNESEMDEILAFVYDQLPDDAASTQAIGQWEEVMHIKSVRHGNQTRGNYADDVRGAYYRTKGGASEVYLQNPHFPENPKKYFKLDNYIPGEEIV